MQKWNHGFGHGHYNKLNTFLKANKNKKILFLELGVGRMTPMFIQKPFWKMTYAWPDAYYITINPRDALVPEELKQKGFAIYEDIAKVLADARKNFNEGRNESR